VIAEPLSVYFESYVTIAVMLCIDCMLKTTFPVVV